MNPLLTVPARPVAWQTWSLTLWIVLCGMPGAADEAGSFPEFRAEAGREYLQAVVASVAKETAANAEACFALARVRSQLGDKPEAEKLARRALESDPSRPEIQAFLAEMLVLQDRMEEAVGFLRQALELKPGIAGGYRRLGMALDRIGDRDGARNALEEAVQRAPQDATAQFLLGQVLLDQGQVKEAEARLRLACQLDANQASAVYLLSQAQSRLGDPEGARASLDKFRELKEREKAALDARNTAYDDEKFMRVLAAGFHTEIAGLLLRQKEAAPAEAHLRQAVRLDPLEPRGQEMLATLLLQSGRLTEARPLCESLVRLRPGDANYRVNLGTVLLQLKESQRAVEELKQALKTDPKQPQALHNLARYYLGAGRDLPEALQLSRRLVALDPTAANYDLLGWACFANSQPGEARAAAAQAVARDPNNPVFQQRFKKLQEMP